MGLGIPRFRALQKSGHSATRVTEKPREEWVDIAKGIAIILVVFLHATFDWAPVQEWVWAEYTDVLETFRMPLFFFAAGLFAAKTLSKSLLELVNDRVVRLVWLYLLWSLVAIAVTQIQGQGMSLAERVLTLPFVPNSATWFIYAIALYFIVAWCMRGFPVWLRLGLATALAVVVHMGVLPMPTDEWYKISQYFVFYLLATAIGPAFRRFVPTVRWPYLLIAPVIYAAGVVAAELLNATDFTPFWLFLAVFAILTGCSVAALLSRVRGFGWLAKLGARTLPVYLLQWYLLMGASMLFALITFPDALVPFIVPMLTTIAVVGALLIYRLTGWVRGLYDRPKWLVKLGDRAVAKWAPRVTRPAEPQLRDSTPPASPAPATPVTRSGIR